MVKNVIVINGPNLNTLGQREPNIYGNQTLDEIEGECIKWGKELGIEVTCYQSNNEGEIVEQIQNSIGTHNGIIINAGAYTHTSIAIHDALKTCELFIIEVHLSNIFGRETFRHHSYISKLALGVICGFGGQGYKFALSAMATSLSTSEE